MLKKASVLLKFFIPSAILFLVLSVILILFSSIQIQNLFKDRIRLTVAGIIQKEAENLNPDDFLLTDQNTIDNIFSQLFLKVKTSEIVRIKVWNTSAKIIYSDDKSAIGKYFTDNDEFQEAMRGEVVTDIEKPTKTENISEQAYDQLLEVYVPVKFSGKDVPSGVIETYFVLDNANAQIKTTQIILIGTIISFALITYILLFIFFRKVIYNPILSLKEAALAIEKGDLSKRVSTNSGDEIGQLTVSFNSMAANLQGYYSSLEGKVKEGTEFIRKVVDTNPNLIYVKDAQGKFTLVNKAVADIYGTTIENIIGKTAGVKNTDDETVLQTLQPKFIAEEPVTFIRTGEIRWFQTIKVPLLYDGYPHQVLSVSTDITERKNTEKRIKELDELKSTFIKIVSHQLRTPLSSVNWNLELLLDKEMGPVTQGQEEIIRVTSKANKEVILRIDDLLKAMDIEGGRLKLEKESTGIESLLNSVFEEFKKEFAVKKINYNLEYPKDPLPQVSADPQSIRDVFHKLIDNALSYTKEDGKINLKLYQSGQSIRFEITDTGIGIPKAEQPHLFQRFHRASNAFALKPDASGLGLYIAKHYIESHGGKIGFISEDGKGSMFWFEIPITGT